MATDIDNKQNEHQRGFSLSWQIVVFPAMIAFFTLAAYGFYLIYNLVGDVHRIAGRSAEPDSAFRRAWEILQDMAATLASDEASERLLTSPSSAELRGKVEMGD